MIFTSGSTAALKLVGECFQFDDDGSFYYLTDSHTSVLGLREIVQSERIIPVLRNEFESFRPQGKSLIAFPAQCNYNGYKFPLNSIKKFHENENNFVLLDAAAFTSTNYLSLSDYQPDFVCLSFYKIFGYPTGLGALLVSKRGVAQLNKKYYGGGTVKIALTRENWHSKRDLIHEQFEDGTMSYLSIISLQSSFTFMDNLLGNKFIERISRHAFNLGKYLYGKLKVLKHSNQQPVACLYHDTNFNDIETQGGIVNFNLRHDDGSYVGFAEFSCIASLHNFTIRTGCFCNPGSCQTYLNLSSDELMTHFKAGHVCGDENDLVNGVPTGSIRISFGYMNTSDEIDKFVEMIEACYVQKRTVINRDEVKLKYRLNKASSQQPTLKSIRIFPLKSCAPMIVFDEWKLSQKGLKYDREWMIINGGNGTALTQKNEPKMCLIKPHIDESRNILRLEFPQKENLEIPLNIENALKLEASICETKICGERIMGYDYGDSVSSWLSDALQIDGLRLLRQSEESERRNGNIALANQAQFLLISEPSVKWLMKYVEEWDIEEDVENIIDRFRGNLIVDNVDELAENEWKSIKIGENEFQVQGPCTRCQMICIDQHTGEKTTEPLRTIGRIFQGKTRFGIYLKLTNFDKPQALKCNENIFTHNKAF